MKNYSGFAPIIAIILVATLTVASYFVLSSKTNTPVSIPTLASVDSIEPTPTASQTPTSTPQVSETQTPKNTYIPKEPTITKTVNNSDKSMGFYYSSDSSILSESLDPFNLTFNGIFNYKGKTITPRIIFLKPNDVVHAKQNETRTLNAVIDTPTSGDYTIVSEWLDNSNLLSQTCHTGSVSGCKYYIVNAIENTWILLAESQLSTSNGYSSVNRAQDWYFVQNCPDGKPCDIKLYVIHGLKDLPISFEQYTPVQNVQTTKYLVPFQMDESSNDRNHASTAQFHMSTTMPTKIDQHGNEGLFIFHLRSGTFERQNL